jgi:predicted nucleic acid-binding protein
MIVIDTSVWIEYLKAREPYFTEISQLLEETRIVAAGCVFGELLQGSKNNRERQIILRFWENLPKGDETDLFIRAGLESGKGRWLDKGVGIIDAAIVVLARSLGARIWTLDEKLGSLLKSDERFLNHHRTVGS